MPSQTIQWFPGHMAKTRRMIAENLKLVDIVLELRDARIPLSSRNPEILSLTAGKPLLTLFTKSSLADPAATARFVEAARAEGTSALAVDCVSGENIARIAPAVRTLLHGKLARYEEKGMRGRTLKAMIVGIPNVGKSSLVNRLSGAKKAKVENRPGVTLDKQWVSTSYGLDLLDMPGVLWPKFDDPLVGENLAVTGAIRDAILDTEALGGVLCRRLLEVAPALFCARYKLGEAAPLAPLSGAELLSLVGKKRGFLLSGGEIDTERAAEMLLEEFRSGRIGRITLDRPPEKNPPEDKEAPHADAGV